MQHEDKFNEIATEERTWYMACELKLRSMKKRKELKECAKDSITGLLMPLLSSSPLPVITEDDDNDFIWKERRKVVRLAYDLFQLLTRTKLRIRSKIT